MKTKSCPFGIQNNDFYFAINDIFVNIRFSRIHLLTYVVIRQIIQVSSTRIEGQNIPWELDQKLVLLKYF